MSARDVVAEQVALSIGAYTPAGNLAPGPVCRRRATLILNALRAMPEPDRLALARELAGPGYAVVPVAEADALQAERDAAVRDYTELREAHDHKAAELVTLRAEVGRLRVELRRTADHLADFAHHYPNDCTAEIDAALYCARAALTPEAAP